MVLTMACLGALVGCASHSGSGTAQGDNALPQKAEVPFPIAVAPAKVPDASSQAVADAAPSSGNAGSHRSADVDNDSDNNGPDLGFNFDNLEVLDPSLKDSLAILRIGAEPKETKLLSVFTGMKNKTGQKLSLEVQTIYKDRAGNPLNTGTWVPMTLKPHQMTEYRSASLSVEASDFLVRIRRAAPAN